MSTIIAPTLRADFTAGPLEVPSTWTDLSTRGRTLSIRRGRSHELDRTTAGRFDALLDNRDRELDPDNAEGSLYPNVRPMRHIQARASLGGTAYDLETAYVEDWGQSWPEKSGADALVPLKGSDAFKLLNLGKVAGTRYSHQLYTDMVEDLLVGANAAYYYLDEASGSTAVDRFSTFDLTAGTNVTFGDASRPPTYGRPCSVAFGPVDDAGNGLFRSTGPAYEQASTQQFYWGCWLRLDTLSTDGYVVGLRTSQTQAPTFIWRMDSSGNGKVRYTDVDGSISHPSLEVTQANYFTADGEWHHYGIRVTITEGGSGVGKLSVQFQKDGVSLSTQTAVYGGASLFRGLERFTGTGTDLLFVGGDGGLGGNHGLDGNMAQLVILTNNSPSQAQAEELGTPVFDYIPQEKPGLQVHSILDSIGWPTTLRSIDTGTMDMEGIAFSPGDSILDKLLAITETSERGRFFVDPSGTITFWDSDTMAARVSRGTFGDSDAEIQYANLETRHDDADIFNQVAVTYRLSGVVDSTVYVEDSTSIASYGPRLLTVDVALVGSADAATLAATLLAGYKDPHTRPVQMELVAVDNATILEQVFTRHPGDLITVRRRPPGTVTKNVTEYEATIEGVSLDYARGVWRAVYDLSGAEVGTKGEPELISGLVAWYAADAIALNDGDPVGTWEDSSVNNNDATQATAANKPTYKTNILNGLPVVRFDGTNDYLAANGLGTLISGADKPFTVVILFRAASGADVYSWGNSGNTVPFLTMRISSDKPTSWKRDDAGSGTQKIPTDGASTTYRIVSHRHTGTAVSLYVNGVATSVLATADDLGTTTTNIFTLGAFGRTTFSGFMNGDIAEAIIYNRALTDSERRQLERYLGAKWGISVA